VTGRAALQVTGDDGAMPGYDAPAPRHPFLVMNPRSGGGKVRQFDLQHKAEVLGAEVFLLEGPDVDVSALARDAVARGADLLGVAGGDGTQALVAGVAAELDVPFMVISAGTRNHFALDLGLDRQDPSNCLAALADDAVELHVDLGTIADRTFVNNASFGAYAAIVQSPAYRGDKAGTTLELLPDLLSGHSGPHLVARADGVTVDHPQAVLVSDNPYGMGDLAGTGRRARMDMGVLGMVAVTVDDARQAVRLLRRSSNSGLTALRAREVVVTADVPEIPVGVDGEALLLPTPVRCTIRPKALRVRVPRNRPGVPPPRAQWDLASLLQLGSFRTRARV
jgi:diacylglycerol kinase family enzyme